MDNCFDIKGFKIICDICGKTLSKDKDSKKLYRCETHGLVAGLLRVTAEPEPKLEPCLN